MTDQTDQEIVAYLDGEMPDEARRAVAARINEDPTFAEAVARHAEVLTQLHRAYPSGADKHFDDRELVALGLLPNNPPIDFDQHRVKPKKRIWANPVWWGAIAASLAGGVAIGRFGLHPQGFVVQREGQLLASDKLGAALDQLGDGGNGPVLIGMSFRGEAGYCRTFRLDQGFAGIGCKSADRWSIPLLVNAPRSSPSSSDFQLAGGDFPPSLMREVDARINGAPLTRAEVDQARQGKWR